MIKKSIFSLSVVLVLIFSSCIKGKIETGTFIDFYDSKSAEITGKTLAVDLNTSQDLLIAVFYKGNKPKYYKQINDGAKTEITADVNITKESYGKTNYQSVEIRLDFDDRVFHVNDVVTIFATIDDGKKGSVVYKVK